MLFKRKKDEIPDLDLDVPEYKSNIPKQSEISSSNPTNLTNFDKEFGTIKKEVGRPMPVQQTKIPLMKQRTFPSNTGTTLSRGAVPGNKPIFIKIDNYRDAMNEINNIKELCKQADYLLDRIHKIREEEDKVLMGWHRDLDKVKEKLLDVDRRLFEL